MRNPTPESQVVTEIIRKHAELPEHPNYDLLGGVMDGVISNGQLHEITEENAKLLFTHAKEYQRRYKAWKEHTAKAWLFERIRMLKRLKKDYGRGGWYDDFMPKKMCKECLCFEDASVKIARHNLLIELIDNEISLWGIVAKIANINIS